MTSQHVETNKRILIPLYAFWISLSYMLMITLTPPMFLPCLGLTDHPSGLCPSKACCLWGNPHLSHHHSSKKIKPE